MSEHIISPEEKRLHEALCNFLNNAGDPMEPVADWNESLQESFKELGAAYNAWYEAHFFSPEERERHKRWADACATASYVVELFKAAETKGDTHPNLIRSSLHRNIADAIFGTLKQTSEERKAGVKPKTMDDKLQQLVDNGDLIKFEGKRET